MKLGYGPSPACNKFLPEFVIYVLSHFQKLLQLIFPAVFVGYPLSTGCDNIGTVISKLVSSHLVSSAHLDPHPDDTLLDGDVSLINSHRLDLYQINEINTLSAQLH